MAQINVNSQQKRNQKQLCTVSSSFTSMSYFLFSSVFNVIFMLTEQKKRKNQTNKSKYSSHPLDNQLTNITGRTLCPTSFTRKQSEIQSNSRISHHQNKQTPHILLCQTFWVKENELLFLQPMWNQIQFLHPTLVCPSLLGLPGRKGGSWVRVIRVIRGY